MDVLYRLIERIEKNSIIMVLRRGIISTVPFVILGSLCLLVAEFPLQPYQDFITSFAYGFIQRLFLLVYQFTSKSISLVLIASVSYSYASKYDSRRTGFYIITALSSYCLFMNSAGGSIEYDIFDSNYTLTAIITTLVSCSLLRMFLTDIRKKNRKSFRSYHYDLQYINSFPMLLKIFAVIAVFGVFGFVLGCLTDGNGVRNIFGYTAEFIFKFVGRNYFGVILYILIVQILWFFGVHGVNVLSNVGEYLFKNPDVIGASAAERFSADIFTPAFLQNFVLTGGSGAILSLVIALLIFSTNKNNRRLAYSGAVTAVFNISEPIIFGLPIIFNPIMFIPFLIVPIVTATITALAVYFGFVPLLANTVSWTTPVLLSGYLASGSFSGVVLQIINLAVGVLIYVPFVKRIEEPEMDIVNKYMPQIINIINECENMGTQAELLSGSSNINIVAHKLLADMYAAMDNNDIYLCYQPQVNDKQEVIGAEGLMRWKHPTCGYIYPPLIIHLAYEDKCLYHITIKIINEAANALANIVKFGAHNFKMSVNISTMELQYKGFCDNVQEIVSKYDFGDSVLAFEITERLALTATPFIEKSIERLRKMGIEIIMDDFGMGHSSMSYLQDNKFSYVKIDGVLVKQILTNERSCDIVETVCELSQKLGFEVIAEYVETEEQRDKLLSVGCKIYQGYLYSPAISFEALIRYLKRNNVFEDGGSVDWGTDTGNDMLDETAAAQRAAAAMHAAKMSREYRLNESDEILSSVKNKANVTVTSGLNGIHDFDNVESSARTAAAIRAAQNMRREVTHEEEELLNIAVEDSDKLEKNQKDKKEKKRIIAEQESIDRALLEKSKITDEMNKYHYKDYKILHGEDKKDE